MPIEIKRITKKVNKTRGKIKRITKKTNKYRKVASELKTAVTEQNKLESKKLEHEGEINSVRSQQKLAKEGIAKLKNKIADIKLATIRMNEYKKSNPKNKAGKARFEQEIKEMKDELQETQHNLVNSLRESPFSKAGKLGSKKLNLKTLENVESHVETTSKEVTKNITEKIKNTEKDIKKTNKKTQKLQKLFEKVEAKAEKTNENVFDKLSKYTAKKYAAIESTSKLAKYETLEKAVTDFRENPNTNPETFMRIMEADIAQSSGLSGRKLEALKRQISKKVKLVKARVIYEQIVNEAREIQAESLERTKAKKAPAEAAAPKAPIEAAPIEAAAPKAPIEAAPIKAAAPKAPVEVAPAEDGYIEVEPAVKEAVEAPAAEAPAEAAKAVPAEDGYIEVEPAVKEAVEAPKAEAPEAPKAEAPEAPAAEAPEAPAAAPKAPAAEAPAAEAPAAPAPKAAPKAPT